MNNLNACIRRMKISKLLPQKFKNEHQIRYKEVRRKERVKSINENNRKHPR